MGLRLLALLCLVGAAFAGPFQRESGSRCSTRCPINSHPKFQYELGKKYTFEYRGENYITIAGNRKQKAVIEGLAEFHYVSRCEGVLRLKNVRISQKLSESEKEQLVKELAIPISYSYEDGKIEKVCPSPQDSKHSLNIKKGILSTIINTMTKLDTPQEVKEEDSLGRCATKYTVKYSNGLEIQKVKDLKSCTNRHTSVTSLISTSYDSPNARIHTLPVFPDEHLVCKQWIKDKFIQKVHCTEHAKIKPMKNRESVVEFDGTIELNLLSQAPSDLGRLETSNGPESILYNLEEESDPSSREREVESILRQMCSKTHGVMDISVSKDFIKLVSLVKTLPYNTLESIEKSLKNGKLCSSKKVHDLFIDTLPMAGSDATIKLLVQLIEKKEITGLKAKLWPASLALIPKPTKETISAIMPLLTMVDSAPILLGVSAMLHRFCSSERSERCENVPEVQEIISNLNSHLGRKCSSKKDDMVFSILKAFGNIGYLGEAEDTILACAKSHKKSLRIRLAAVDAFRRVMEKRPDELLELYLDPSENFELRINVLSSVMKHADEQQLKKIKNAIAQEEDTQVSAYASTLISNMKKTSTPHKKNVKKLLREIEVNPPKVNFWENSKNLEFSLHHEALNIGGSFEGDIIHSPESKIPQSMYSRFDLDLFDKSINLMEIGVRAEGLEELARKLMGLKDKVPKMPGWDWFHTENILGDSKADLSLFIRTMNVELFDVSASDLTALGEIIQIANMMTKLSHERKADFSHSFLFMNSQLVIPSVTGRSYSLGLTGSATVGLTASTKLNLLSFPRNADAKAHFQPSVNVEVSTTVGIQSNKQRPDLKLVSRMHMESAMEAQFKISDGHIALASLSMPSENIALAKFSSDVIEIEADHTEKRLFETMQKKINYCMDKLEKPLGVSLCAKWEVPKPFVVKSFPFIQGVGEVEIALKKTDPSFSSYEVSVEIPRQHSSHMKFQASLDTPGSSVNRRCAVEMDVKDKGRYHKELSMEITSPFKSVGGRGSLTKKSDLIEGSLELHTESLQLFSINASTAISSSRSKTSYKPSLEVSVVGRQPFKMAGTASVSKGRKQQISFDIKANKPTSKPVSIKGTILKEGKFEFSRRSEWKLSSDLDISLPMVSSQVRSSLEKKSGSLSKLSSSLSVDYEIRRMSKQSVKFTALTQTSSSKINTNARFQSTQFPSTNWEANWDMQGDIRESLKNDLTVKYGRNPERNYVTIKHTSSMPSFSNGQCSMSVKAPQFNIDSDIKVSHRFEDGETPKLKWNADLRYKDDKHVKGLIDFDYTSKHPLKATTKAEIELPSGKYSYNDHIEETEPGHYNGKSRLQYKEKYAELEYTVKQDSGRHFEIDGSLKTSYSTTPMKTKLSYSQDESSLEIEGQLSVKRNSEYSVEARLAKSGSSHLNVKSPQGEGSWRINNEPQRKSAEWDMKLKSRRSRRVTGSVAMDMEDEKKFSVEIMTDADRHPEKKIAASSSMSVRGDMFNSILKLQVNDLISVSIAESGENSLLGSYECSVDASSKHFEPTEINYKHDLSKSQGKSSVTVTKNGVPKIRAQIEGSLGLNQNQRECAVKAALESLDNSFENKEFSMRHGFANVGSSKAVKSEIKYQHSPRKVYKAEWNSDIQSKGMELNAVVNTPHKNFEEQSLGVSFQKSEDSVVSSVSISVPNNKVISLSSEIKSKNQGFTAIWKAKTPFDIVRNVKVHLSIDNERSRKSLSTYIDVNSARIADVEADMSSSSSSLDLNGQLKISPIPNVSFQGASFSYHHTRSSKSISAKIDLANSKHLSLSSEIKNERSTISTTTSLTTPFRKIRNAKMHVSIENKSSQKTLLSYIDINEERKGDIEMKILSSSRSLELQGRLKTSRTPEISAHFNVDRSEGSFQASGKLLKGTSPLWSTEMSRQRSENSEQLSIKTESFEKSLLDLQVSSDLSNEEMKLTVEASGKFSPVKLSITTGPNDHNSAKMEIHACRGSSSKCYTLKAHHKTLKHSENYSFYKNLIFEVEKTSESSEPEPLGSLEFLLSSSDRDFDSKILLKVQDKNLGYEVKVHRRHHEEERCSMEMQLYMPQCTSTLSSTILHSSKTMLWEMEFIPTTSAPEQKFSIELKREKNDREVTGHLKINRPSAPKPILVKVQLEKRGWIPVKGKVEMHYSPSSWFKTLTLEITPEEDRSGKKSIMYRLYREDQSLDLSAKLMKQKSRDEDMYGYDWSIKSNRITKKGGFSVTVAKTRHGRPETIQIAYYSPNTDLKIEGSNILSAQSMDSGIVVKSKGRTINEMRLRTKNSCVHFEVERSGPFFKSSLCLNKREGRTLELVSIDATCRRHKCLNVKVAVDPSSSSFVDVDMEWKKEELRRSLSEMTGLDSLEGIRIQEIRHKLEVSVRRFVASKMMPSWRDVVSKFEEIKDYYLKIFKTTFRRHSENLKESMKQIKSMKESMIKEFEGIIPWGYIQKELWNPLKATVFCILQGLVKTVMSHIPDLYNMLWSAVKEQFWNCFKKFCTSGTFCSNFRKSIERYGLERTLKKHFEQSKAVIKETVDTWVPMFLSPWRLLRFAIRVSYRTIKHLVGTIISNMLRPYKMIFEIVRFVTATLEKLFGKFVTKIILHRVIKFGVKLEDMIRQKAMDLLDYVINKFNDWAIHAKRDEDVRTAISLVKDAKKKAIRSWRNRDDLAKQAWEPVEASLKENIKRMIRDRFEMTEYKPSQGIIRFKVRNPLGRAQLEIIKNEILTLKSKIVGWMVRKH